MDMSNKNKCLRDPVFYRCKTDVAHHRTGFTYKAYPTYDFACPIVDSIEGVTHAMRTIEYKDREPMYHWVLEHVPGLRKVELIEFAKTQFSHTILSKRKLTWFVENGFVDGWDDPRFPTVQGVMRRGMTVEALADFVMTQGMSKATNLMEWDKIWAINRGKIDPIVPRFPAVGSDAAVVLTLDGPADVTCKMEKKHAKNEELGERVLLLSKAVYLEQDDAQAMEQGEQITLMHWGNAFVDKIVKDPKTGMVTSLVGRLNLEGNVKDTKKKVHWVPKLEDQITPVILRELDHLVTKPKIEDDDDIKDLINPVSSVDTAAIGDPLLKTLPKGSMLQLERRGYYIVDVPAFPLGKPMLLIKIPDGKAKDTSSIKSKVDPSKLQGSHGTKKGEKAAPAEKAPASESVADPAASQKPAAKAKASGKAKAKATGGGKPEDRPLDDISRLNLVVGKITKVWEHPEADKLWCEEIDLGEGAPRTIASGLRLHLKDSEMVNQLVIVLANLKHRKLVGFMSQGMVLCATGSDGRVELLQPPSGAKVGERVAIEGVEMGEPDAQLNEKTGKAPLVALKDGMRTTDGKQAAYNGAVWQTSAGPVACKSVADGTIS
jgi:glutamyl-tRNA synthetase